MLTTWWTLPALHDERATGEGRARLAIWGRIGHIDVHTPTTGRTTMPRALLRFRKMNGLGNVFAVFDARETPVDFDIEAIRVLGADESIGFDQMITLEPSGGGADVFMRIHNKDGSEVDACGNATRCVGWLVMGENGRDAVTIETNAGLLRATNAGIEMVTVDMGKPRLGWRDIPLARPFDDTRAIDLSYGPVDAPILSAPAVVSMGNPHAIFFVDDVDAIDLGHIGPILEHDPLFPERANISLAHVTARDAVTLRTWERGAGLTRACGTAACAGAVAAMRRGLTDRAVTMMLPGGPLRVEWRDDDHVMMTGPVETEFTGVVDPNTLALSVAEKGAA